MSKVWDERLRLIRFRRKRERSTFREELRILPKWLVWTCLGLTLLALIIGVAVNLNGIKTGGDIFPGDESLRHNPLLSTFGLIGVILVVGVVLSSFILTLGYVYRDAKRRRMNGALWTLLVLILAPMYLFIGLIIYMLVREPLPYTCPQCSANVSARFNFCPNCKYNLHPACPQCQQEVSDTDKFCPYCATQLKQPTATESGPTPMASTSA
jgi:hypothetical protein